MKKQFVIPVLGFMIVASTAFASNGGYHHKGHADKVAFLEKKLDLSKEQVAQIEQLRDRLLKPKEEMRAQRKATREQLHELDVNAVDYNEQLSAIAEAVGQYTGEAASNHVLFKGGMMSILTPAQQEKLASMKERRQKRLH